jgi:hypothetical protein
MVIHHVNVDASNPYQDFAKLNNLNYGDVLNYVGILDGEEKTYWHNMARMRLTYPFKFAIGMLREQLRKHYGITQ